jgi:hypothetical protein
MGGFRLAALFANGFWTRNVGVEDFEGLMGVVTALFKDSTSVFKSASISVEGPQLHFCFRGMAAVTAVPEEQEHGFDEGCGHELKGLPGFRTGTMSRSFACVHFVERWPRMHGSQAIFNPLMRGMMNVLNQYAAGEHGERTMTAWHRPAPELLEWETRSGLEPCKDDGEQATVAVPDHLVNR